MAAASCTGMGKMLNKKQHDKTLNKALERSGASIVETICDFESQTLGSWTAVFCVLLGIVSITVGNLVSFGLALLFLIYGVTSLPKFKLYLDQYVDSLGQWITSLIPERQNRPVPPYKMGHNHGGTRQKYNIIY